MLIHHFKLHGFFEGGHNQMTGRNMKTGGAYFVQFGKILLVAATNLYGGLVFCKSSKV